MIQTETVIIGAGPYGLSIAAHLKAAHLPFRLYGKPMESWRSYMPEGMLLKSEPFASNLWDPNRRYTVERYCAEKHIPYEASGRPLSLAIFLDYAEWFRRHAVGETIDLKVIRVRQTSAGYRVELANGDEVACHHVILATGHMAFRSVPRELSALPEPLCLHSAQLHSLQPYRDRDVTLVGAGQSALETAALLHEVGARVRVLARTRRIQWNGPSAGIHRSLVARIRNPEAGLGSGWRSLAISELPRVFRFLFGAEKRHRFVEKSWGPSGAAWLRKRLEGKVDILVSHKIRAAQKSGDRVLLEVEGPDGVSEIMTDRVIAATGFNVDLDRVSYLDTELRKKIAREGRVPALDARFETSVPGLFIVGLLSAPTFGPVMRFMFGAKHAAPIITRRLKSRHGQPWWLPWD